ncbi:class I SAM-dependent DNA methyltransferase [Sphingomonas sp. HITSZ_GF]|uniref:class I SAM-dependent DNA methyltransferase n=1 Tax=Sphingomonas sp. HITSZ_GF TaxID=3037247 RepID=UPI00240D6CFD|nr:DNA methyltransferase [Sphingomonas sp. HITSZ_GF]MDG2533847.1 class I SAM-dependent DNA methyltransferase [Sphingomonas sp. HITSZ_GF]
MHGGNSSDAFIDRWRKGEGGAERANYALFLVELADFLDLPHPDPAGATHENNDYVFERAVREVDDEGHVWIGRIDLYRRGCFVLEAKQSRWKDQLNGIHPSDPPFRSDPEAPLTLGRRSAGRDWDVLMRNARDQAERYARALDEAHGWPPFLIVCDVGHCLELYADFSGQGKNYRQFPDRAGFRIYLEDLRAPKVRDLLRAIWLDPHSLDPAKHAAAVTRRITSRLAKVSKSLEERDHSPEKVAHFLMRCMFTMFSEDVGLLDRGSFTEMLGDARDNPAAFAPMLEDLWRTMDKGGISPVLRRRVRYFNGGLFADATAIPLRREEIGELFEAANHNWTEVEPAIFGALLEQALHPEERRQLGAHYTPRAYVERLVIATIIAPLREEWRLILATVERLRLDKPIEAIGLIRDFQARLAVTRILDPACGTGNFLYVALELMKQLEGEVLEALAALGGQEALALETMSVDPRNFLGLEVNPRAAAIAELVLWLGYLQWHLRNGGGISDPVLKSFGNIRRMDSILAHDPEHPNAERTATERPNPRRPEWPQADYIIGNPPFIGGKDLRARLPEGYAEALWKAHPHLNKSADLVMYWWDRAAELLAQKGTTLKRFGFVTTNSITQEFSRRVMTKRLCGNPPLHLAMAIPDHPWTKASPDAAAVRIAMTVVARGEGDGLLHEVLHEEGLDSDQPRIALHTASGRIHPDLTVGVDITATVPLRANAGLSSPGVKLHGAGFIVTPAEAVHLGLGRREGLDRHIRPYRNGRDLTARARGVMVIDLFGLAEVEVRQRFPEVYGHLLRTVKPERDRNNRASYRDNWWVFGEPRRELRPALDGLSRYIATVETAKHRVFQFLEEDILPDNKLVCVGLADAHNLGILSSSYHVAWSLRAGGWLGVGNDSVYVKSKVFDPFPFPDMAASHRRTVAGLAEELDAARKAVLAEHGDLTLTGLYNLREQLVAGRPFAMAEQDQRIRGRVDLIAELHDQLDAAVAAVYGWPADLAEEDVIARLVALNAERVSEERAGRVRWLRPEYQLARSGVEMLAPQSAAMQFEVAPGAVTAGKPVFPRDAVGQTAAVFDSLRDGKVWGAAEIAGRYAQGRKATPRIEATLAALARLGHVAVEQGGYRLRRVA